MRPKQDVEVYTRWSGDRPRKQGAKDKPSSPWASQAHRGGSQTCPDSDGENRPPVVGSLLLQRCLQQTTTKVRAAGEKKHAGSNRHGLRRLSLSTGEQPMGVSSPSFVTEVIATAQTCPPIGACNSKNTARSTIEMSQNLGKEKIKKSTVEMPRSRGAVKIIGSTVEHRTDNVTSTVRMPQKNHGKEDITRSTVEHCTKKAASMVQMPRRNHGIEKTKQISSVEIPQNNCGKEKIGGSSRIHQHRKSAVSTIRKAGQKENIENRHTSRCASAGQAPMETSSHQLSAHTGWSWDAPPNLDCKNSVAEKVMTTEEINSAIQELRELGFGEDMSSEEFHACLDQLNCRPSLVDTSLELNPPELHALYKRHAYYRMKTYKLSQGVHEDMLEDAKLEEAYPLSVLEEEDYFLRFEKDGTLDWPFHADHFCLASLDDYQRLVPHNHWRAYVGFEYERWDDYRKFFYDYETEQEYANYCTELSEKLKWLEDYILVGDPLWGIIRSRGTEEVSKHSGLLLAFRRSQ